MWRALLVACALAAGTAHAGEHSAGALPTVEERLDNGLVVIVAPDPSVATVAVHVRYLGGAADDDAAHAGDTKLLEHLLAAGSVHVPEGELEARLTAIGGWTATASSLDHVGVTDVAPARALDLALWLEAERMAGLADGMQPAAIERAVVAVRAERAAALEDHPYARVEYLAHALLWADHPNAHALLDPPRAASPAAARALVRTRVVPARAILVIAGRVDPAAALARARRYFGWIPAGTPPALASAPPPSPLSAAPPPAREEDPQTHVLVAFRTDRAGAADEPAFDVLARILALRLARAVPGVTFHATVVHQRLGGELHVEAFAPAGTDPAPALAAIQAELARLVSTQISPAELARITGAVEGELVSSLEPLAIRADQLAAWRARGGAGAFPESTRALTPAGLQQLASTWLRPTSAVTVTSR